MEDEGQIEFVGIYEELDRIHSNISVKNSQILGLFMLTLSLNYYHPRPVNLIIDAGFFVLGISFLVSLLGSRISYDSRYSALFWGMESASLVLSYMSLGLVSLSCVFQLIMV